MRGRSRQAGLIPGFVIEINIAFAVLVIASTVMWTWSLNQFHPLPVEPIKAELVVPVVPAADVPKRWRVAQGEDGVTLVQRDDQGWQMFVVPAFLLATIVAVFVAPLHWPYWLLLACLCGVWGYGITLGPGNQQVRIAPDGVVEMRGAAWFALLALRSKRVIARDVETVLVHRDRPEAYVVFRTQDVRRGWRLYADHLAEAHAVAVAVQARFRVPPAAIATPKGEKK